MQILAKIIVVILSVIFLILAVVAFSLLILKLFILLTDEVSILKERKREKCNCEYCIHYHRNRDNRYDQVCEYCKQYYKRLNYFSMRAENET